MAPLFSLPGLDGVSYSLVEQRGHVVVLNFWSAECPHAERVDRELAAVSPGWGERVALWTIAANANEPVPLLRQVGARRGIAPLLHDAAGEVADLYGAQTTPHFFVVDVGGILRYQGAFDDVTFRQRTPSRFYLRQAVEAVLSGRRPEPEQTAPYGCAIVRFSP
jgi:peroxiredoxin